MSFWSSLGNGLLSLLTGGISSYIGNLGKLLSAGGDTLNNADPAAYLDNYMAKQTGSRLTDAEREANEWSASREDLAYERSKMAYQNQVADMQAAGLNPAMMYGGGAGGGTAVPAPSSSVAPAGGSSINLGSLLQMALEAKMLPAKIANIKADTAKKTADAASTEQQVDFFSRIADLRVEAEKLQNNLTRGRAREIDINIGKMRSETEYNIAHTKSEEKKLDLYVQQSILAKAEADNIEYMRPYLQMELSARSQNEREMARAASVRAAYSQGLIDEGAIKAIVRADNARASESEVNSEVQKIVAEIKSKESESVPRLISGSFGERCVAGLRVISRTIQGK